LVPVLKNPIAPLDSSAPPPGVRAGETLWMGALLLLLLAVFFAPALRPGHVLAPTNMTFSTNFYHSLQPPGWTRHATPMRFDVEFRYVPWSRMTWERIRAGQCPLWNPDSYCGAPLAATMEATVFYPFTWLAALLPFGWTFVFRAMAQLWVAGWGTCCLARHYGLGRAGALTSAMAFMLCGFNVAWLGFPLGIVATWLPLLLLATDKALLATTFRDAARPIALLGLAGAVQWTGGNPETSLDLFFCVGLYVLLRGLALARGEHNVGWKHWLGRPAMAAGLGVLIAAPAIVSFLEWLPLSQEFSKRMPAGQFCWWNAKSLWHIKALPLLLLPDFYGNPLWNLPGRPSEYCSYYSEVVLYVGAVPLMLAIGAVVGMLRGRERVPEWLRPWFWIGLICFGRAMMLPVFDWVNQALPFRLELPMRLRFVVAFALCLLAGQGMQQWIEGIKSGARGHARGWMATAGVLIVVAALLGAFSPARTHFQLYWPVVALGGALVVMGLGAWRALPPWALAILMAGIAFADLHAFGRHFIETIPANYFFPENPIFAPARQDRGLFRVTALESALMPDQQMMLHQSDVRGMDFQLLDYQKYMMASGALLGGSSYGMILKNLNSPLLRALNVKYVLAPNEPRYRDIADVDWIGEEPRVLLGRLRHVQPRSYLVHRVDKAKDDAEAERMIVADPARVFRTAILSEANDAPAASPIEPSLAATESVTVLAYEPERSEWRVRAATPGFMVTTDAWYPGWRARVDGRPAKIYRANLAFRAVWVPAGEHVVTHDYAPAWWLPSLACSALGLLLMLVLAAWGRAWQSTRSRA
jgi:hypothetical protein